MLTVNENELDRLIELLRRGFGGLDNRDNGIAQTGFVDIAAKPVECGVSTYDLMMGTDVRIDRVYRLAASPLLAVAKPYGRPAFPRSDLDDRASPLTMACQIIEQFPFTVRKPAVDVFCQLPKLLFQHSAIACSRIQLAPGTILFSLACEGT